MGAPDRGSRLDQNPYQPSGTDSTAALSNAGMRVEGKHLVVRSGAALPPFRVETNEAITQQEIQQRRLGWCPPIVGPS